MRSLSPLRSTRPLPAALVLAALAALPAVAPPARAEAPKDVAAEAHAIVEELVACGTRHSLSSWSDPKRGAGCGRDVAKRRFEALAAASGGRLRVVVDAFESQSARTGNQLARMENVYAVLDGPDAALRKTAFAVSGHMDSRASDPLDAVSDAPGADDDASGVAAALLAAREILANAKGLRATLVFAALSGEEQGLLGARRFKEWLAREGYTVGGMITNDIVGATNGAKDRRLRVFSGGGPDGVDSPSRELARRVEEVVGRGAVRLVFRSDRFGRGGDHLPFVEEGLPAVRFTEPLEDYRHQHQTPRVEAGVRYGDLVEFMDFGFLAEVASINAKVLAALAAAPAPPKGVTLGGAVTPSAKVTIEADEDAERAGFEILIRETTEARWTVLKPVPAAGEHVLSDMSTDNEHFAVRSVGKNGARSRAVPATAPPRR